MEALGHPVPIAALGVSSLRTRKVNAKCWGGGGGSSSSRTARSALRPFTAVPSRPGAATHTRVKPIPPKCRRVTVRMGVAVEDEEDPAKQMKEMAAARRRWDALIRDQKIKVLTPREAGYAIQLSDKALLDVRPSMERQKAWVKGSYWIPIFDVDNTVDFGTISRKITNYVMGGWWSGVPTLAYDNNFIANVENRFPKDTDLIVVCQKGLRSLAACEQLYNAGYRNLFWVQGGLEAAEEEDLQREGPQPFKLGGIGGVSEFLGWTDQQRIVAAKEGWGYRFVFTARLVGLVILADALLFGVQQVGPLLQELRSH